MSIESFDDFDSTNQMSHGADIKPFPFRDDKTRDGTLEWLNENFREKKRRARSRIDFYRRYNNMYKNAKKRQELSSKPRHSVNFVYDKTEDRVAQMDRMGINISVIPFNQDEQSDINNAKACKKLLVGKADELGLHEIENKADRTKFMFGNSFTFALWNKDIGGLHPKYKKYKEQGIKIPKMKNGKKEKGKYLDDIMLGDIEVFVKAGDKVFPEIGKTCWDRVNELDLVDYVNKWELIADYPQYKDKLEGLTTSRDYEIELKDSMSFDDNMVQVRTFFYKKTKHLPDGIMIRYTDSCILDWTSYPYDEDCLPCVPDTDIDVEDELWARPFVINIEQMCNYYNDVQATQASNFGIGGRPKWFLPKGSAKVSQLNNSFAIVEYLGALAPKLETPRTSNPESFTLQDRLENKITRFSRTSEIARGELPQGVTATSAIRLLDEQHSRMIKPMEEKRKRRVIETYRMLLRRIQQFYGKGDGRIVRYLGKNNDYLISSFDEADFSSVADVRIEASSALSDSKSGKISDIIDLNMSTQTDPIFRKEEIIQMLDLGLDESFKDGATVAVTAANTVVEELLSGKSVPEPQQYDNFMVHYMILDRAMQSFSFRTKVSEDVRKRFELYMLTLEQLMWERAKVNMKFAMLLSNTENYPMFFTPDEPLQVVLMKHQAQPQVQPDKMQGGADTSKIETKGEK